MINVSTHIASNSVITEAKQTVKAVVVKPELKSVEAVLPAKAEVLTTQELKTSNVKNINILENTSKVTTTQAVLSNSKRILSSGLMGIPADAVTNSFDYEKGKINSKLYVAKTANAFVGWSVFEAGTIAAVKVGSKIAGKQLGAFSTMAIGTGCGMIAYSLYNRTAGKALDNKVASYIPEKLSKPIADSMANYVAKPINKYVINPIKAHPKTSIAIGVTVATALTIKYPKGFGIKVLGSTGVCVTSSFVLNKLLGNPVTLPKPNVEANKPVSKEELAWALETEKKFKQDPKSVPDADAVKYYNILQRVEVTKK